MCTVPLSAVDNRQYKRILYEVLDHDPSHDESEAFLGRLKTALDERELVLKGITTYGSALYPEPIRQVFGDVPHQICTFHVIKELTKGVRRPHHDRVTGAGKTHRSKMIARREEVKNFNRSGFSRRTDV